VFALRGAWQRSIAARTEADLYRRVVRSILRGDVLRASLLPDEEARVSLFQALHYISSLLAEALPDLVASLVAGSLFAVIGVVSPAPRAGALALAALLLGGGILFSARRWVDRGHAEAWRSWERVAELVSDVCEGRLELVAAGRQNDFIQGFGAATRAWDEKQRWAGRLSGLLGRLPIVALMGAAAAAVLIDARAHDLAWPAVAFRAALVASVAPTFLGIARSLQQVAANEKRLALVIRVLDSEVDESSGSLRPPKSPKKIEWRGVCFAYPGAETPVLTDASFSWSEGELLALTGANGSGKSTCLRVLLGLARPERGDVFVDGKPLAELHIESWRREISFLPQRPYLPARATVREYLRVLDSDVQDEEMMRTLERVGVLDGLRRASADPLARRLGDLSVGERQRVALARALCRRAPVLLLDEPDANLDREGIELTARLVKELTRERMVGVVAHTRDLLKAADRIVTLDAGKIVSSSGSPLDASMPQDQGQL
jgi:ABC-type multidrug transport system fused ATPase/permease subunit